MSKSPNNQNNRLSIHNTFNLEEIDSIVTLKSILSVYDTEGAYRVKNSQESRANYRKELLLLQKEIIVFFIDGTSAVYRYWKEDDEGIILLGGIKGKYTLNVNEGRPVRQYGRVHGFNYVSAVRVIPGSPHIFTGSGDRRIVLWDFTRANPDNLSPDVLDSISTTNNINDIAYIEE